MHDFTQVPDPGGDANVDGYGLVKPMRPRGETGTGLTSPNEKGKKGMKKSTSSVSVGRLVRFPSLSLPSLLFPSLPYSSLQPSLLSPSSSIIFPTPLPSHFPCIIIFYLLDFW